MDIDYRLYLQELDRIEQDNQAEIWAVMTETTEMTEMISYEKEMELPDQKAALSPLYDDEF